MELLKIFSPLIMICLIYFSCSNSQKENDMIINNVAQSYVKLALQVGQHDPDYVDAYYGPGEWRERSKKDTSSLADIADTAAKLLDELASFDLAGQEEIVQLRYQYLSAQLRSLAGRVAMLRGRKMSFDEESFILYDGVAPHHPESEFAIILDTLETMIPGKGDLWSRFQEYRKSFVVPGDSLAALFGVALEEARRRTKEYIELPAEESFHLEFVHDQPWGAYNWYQGKYHSLIQINQDLPVYIDRVVGLVCHEGYPGHHVYNILLEENLYNKRRWVEYSVYPLFSPQSLIAEGTANYASGLTFPGTERIEFEREVLFPMAGIDPNTADLYYRILNELKKLKYTGTEAARLYLDGQLNKEETIGWLMRNGMSSRERAAQNIRFYEKYRSYQVNYSLGSDLVEEYINTKVGENPDPVQRWQQFENLLSSPRIASELK